MAGADRLERRHTRAEARASRTLNVLRHRLSRDRLHQRVARLRREQETRAPQTTRQGYVRGREEGVSVRRLRLRVRASSYLSLRGWGGSRSSAAQPRSKAGCDLEGRSSFIVADAGEQTSPAYAACGRSGETGAGCGWGRRAVGSYRRDVNLDAVGAPVRDSSDVLRNRSGNS